jgi:hypothetical protein
MSTVIGIISLVAGLAGSASAANSQRQAAEAESKAYEYNAQLKEQDANQSKQKAMWEESISREQSRDLISKQRVMYAKSGVDISEGSPLLVTASSAEDAEKDALAIRWAGDVDYTQGINESKLLRFYGRNAEKTGKTQANATMLQGIGNAGMAYGQGKTTTKTVTV